MYLATGESFCSLALHFRMGVQQFPELSEKLVKLNGKLLKISVYQNVRHETAANHLGNEE
jgi:hypothetical protein